MPRKPLYRLHKASGQARCQHRGNRVYLGKYDSPESKAKYAQIVEEWARDQQEIHGGQPAASKASTPPSPARSPSHCTIIELIEHWLPYGKSKYTKSELGHFRSAARVLVELFRDHPVAEFGPRNLGICRDWMATDRGWSFTYINKQVNRIIAIFKWGTSEEIVPEERVYTLRTVRKLEEGQSVGDVVPRTPAEVEPIDWGAVELVLPYMSEVLATMVQVQYLTGMRGAEVCQLSAAEIDFESHAPEWLYAPKHHKTRKKKKAKLVFFGPQTRELLEPFREKYLEGFWFRPEDSYAELAQKTTRDGRHADIRTRKFAARFQKDTYNHAIKNSIKRARNAAELAARESGKSEEEINAILARYIDWHPHQLRHTRATLTRESYGVEGAAAQTGNSVTASQIYAPKNVKLARQIARETG